MCVCERERVIILKLFKETKWLIQITLIEPSIVWFIFSVTCICCVESISISLFLSLSSSFFQSFYYRARKGFFFDWTSYWIVWMPIFILFFFLYFSWKFRLKIVLFFFRRKTLLTHVDTRRHRYQWIMIDNFFLFCFFANVSDW